MGIRIKIRTSIKSTKYRSINSYVTNIGCANSTLQNNLLLQLLYIPALIQVNSSQLVLCCTWKSTKYSKKSSICIYVQVFGNHILVHIQVLTDTLYPWKHLSMLCNGMTTQGTNIIKNYDDTSLTPTTPSLIHELCLGSYCMLVCWLTVDLHLHTKISTPRHENSMVLLKILAYPLKFILMNPIHNYLLNFIEIRGAIYLVTLQVHPLVPVSNHVGIFHSSSIFA